MFRNGWDGSVKSPDAIGLLQAGSQARTDDAAKAIELDIRLLNVNHREELDVVIAQAAALGKRGKRVLVLEQHSVPGGQTQTFRRGDWVWVVPVTPLRGDVVVLDDLLLFLAHVAGREDVNQRGHERDHHEHDGRQMIDAIADRQNRAVTRIAQAS